MLKWRGGEEEGRKHNKNGQTGQPELASAEGSRMESKGKLTLSALTASASDIVGPGE